MSLAMLVGGAECGPSNPLQSLSKRFDQDRGVHQDFRGGQRAESSSREVFRTQQATSPELHQHAEHFFNSTTAPATPLVHQPFNLTALHDVLPQLHPSVQSPQTQTQFPSGWATDFLSQTAQTSVSAPVMKHVESQQDRMQSPAPMTPGLQGSMHWSPPLAGYRMNPMSGMMAAAPLTMQRPALHTDQSSWDREFQTQETMLNAQVAPAAKPAVQSTSTLAPHDNMAELAARVIDAVKDEQNPKFQQSQFINLMRQLRDGEVVVEDDKIVPRESSMSIHVDVKGKGRAFDIPVREVRDPVLDHPISTSSVQEYQGSAELNEAYRQQLNDSNEAYFQQENEELAKYWEAHVTGPVPNTLSAGDQGSWHQLQQDWDNFETSFAGIKPIMNYQFQNNNPYLQGDSSRTLHHVMHMSQAQRAYDSVLELEAAVQRDPTNAAAWFELGVKQQENEREVKAIQALERSVELEPSHLSAWLALSVSYTNNNNRIGVYNAIKEWALRNSKYQHIVESIDFTKADVPSPANFGALAECLIRMARGADEVGGVDADVQIALAVLLNTTEEYGKAQDCFLAALAVRPDDWLLYNRVGATMANNGQADKAIQYYYLALDLNPAYIRARFNLGISCINLHRYEEAQSHILDALVLQDSDGVADNSGMNDKRGVISSTLWESLKTTCLHLQRVDLASLCDRRDLDGFRNVYENVRPEESMRSVA